MKLRWLAIAVATAAFSVVPWMQAQTQNPPQSQPPATDPDAGQPKAGDIQNAPKQDPAALPTQDDSQIKHDGGKTDVGDGLFADLQIRRRIAIGPSFDEEQLQHLDAIVLPSFTPMIEDQRQAAGNGVGFETFSFMTASHAGNAFVGIELLVQDGFSPVRFVLHRMPAHAPQIIG